MSASKYKIDKKANTFVGIVKIKRWLLWMPVKSNTNEIKSKQKQNLLEE